MWSKLLRLFRGDRRPVVSPVANATLGMLTYSHDDGCWATDESNEDLPFRFFVAGNWSEQFSEISPDPQLIAHAESVARSSDEFLAAVASMLTAECGTRLNKGWTEEIARLKVSALNLPWPERPDDGMIQFDGPDPDRLWRCDYIGRRPVSLGFDS